MVLLSVNHNEIQFDYKLTNMKKFSKSETIGIAIIFVVLIVISVPNFIASLKRSRDQVRKDDMGALVPALSVYHTDNGDFPLSSPDGRIVACIKPGDVGTKDKTGRTVFNYIPCNWGVDAFGTYIPRLPRDPDFKKGAGYRYISDGSRYQIYVSLESPDDAEYDPKIIARNLICGNLVCNAGRAYGRTPTDISIEQYELEIMKK